MIEVDFDGFKKATQRLMEQNEGMRGGIARQGGIVAANLYGKIVSRTPYNVKGEAYPFSGNAQQSWKIDVVPGGSDEILGIEVVVGGNNKNRTGSPKISYNSAYGDARSALGDLEWLEGQTILISSDIDYMRKLENGQPGGSDQAPDGFVRLAVHDAEKELVRKIERRGG